MFIWLTNPAKIQVLVNCDLITRVIPSSAGNNRSVVCFTDANDCFVVEESCEDIYERIQSAEKRNRK